jgi:hypothetical protein
VPLIPHSDELGALARALARTTRALADWFGLAHSAPTSDVHCRHPSTGAAAPATASAFNAPHEAGHGVTRKPRVTAPSPGLGAKGVHTQNVCALPDPTTRIASVRQSSRELGPLHLYPCASNFTTARLEPHLGSTETTPAALREKLVPMWDTPDRQLQLDFQRRAPEPCTDCSDLAARASSAFHDTRLTSATGTGLEIGVFFRSEPRLQLPLMPAPATPAPRERHRIQMRDRNTFIEGRCRVTAAGCHHATA